MVIIYNDYDEMWRVIHTLPPFQKTVFQEKYNCFGIEKNAYSGFEMLTFCKSLSLEPERCRAVAIKLEFHDIRFGILELTLLSWLIQYSGWVSGLNLENSLFRADFFILQKLKIYRIIILYY